MNRVWSLGDRERVVVHYLGENAEVRADVAGRHAPHGGDAGVEDVLGGPPVLGVGQLPGAEGDL